MTTQTRASWIFGSLFVAFLLGVFIFGPNSLPEYKQHLLGYFCALLAGVFCIFFTGSLLLNAELPIAGKWAVQGGAGFALFLVVLFWWYSPAAPVKAAPEHPNPPSPAASIDVGIDHDMQLERIVDVVNQKQNIAIVFAQPCSQDLRSALISPGEYKGVDVPGLLEDLRQGAKGKELSYHVVKEGDRRYEIDCP
jgi:hypothetical protein